MNIRFTIYVWCLFTALIAIPSLLVAQAPQTIIIASDNGQGTGDSISYDLEAVPYDPAETEVPCQPISRSTYAPLQVEVNDVIHYETSQSIPNLGHLLVSIVIHHENLTSSFYQTTQYSLSDLTILPGDIIEIPLNFTLDLDLQMRLNPDLTMLITISSLQNSLVPLPDASNFEFRSFGRYHTSMCVGFFSWKNSFLRSGQLSLENPEPISFPNPFDHYLEVKIVAGESERPEIELMDMNGRIMPMNPKLKYAGENTWIASVPTAHIPAGIYLSRVKVSQKIYTKKLFKK